MNFLGNNKKISDSKVEVPGDIREPRNHSRLNLLPLNQPDQWRDIRFSDNKLSYKFVDLRVSMFY
jgi:hypothetical protein